jgi:hypothetical protein
MSATTEKLSFSVGLSTSAPTISIVSNVTCSLSDDDIWTISGSGFEFVSEEGASKTAALLGWLSKVLGVT